ncbi:hypothetical protein L3Q65_18365 [Amycolatopsis sp. FU40]|uniref:hypothetical protein n=1 Tax=Amycolatopsis sp. FU40 TaxID=2914159 RepID=UPI001F27184D|nr:hypothetical protein [Amycolatopsis sp. FU40]UKD58602.1 hypothetical protein L3Q65_18365 [Amycolatopsis sp. FU40]
MLVVTCALVATLGVSFAIIQWDVANKIATTISALGAVAAVGVAVRAALSGPQASGVVCASDTGRAAAESGGGAITGISGKVTTASSLRAANIVHAEASGAGAAITTGVYLD